MAGPELQFRTEDLTLEEVGDLFVETAFDRQTINSLKSKKTIVLQGARGVGKSFLLKVAQKELDETFGSDRVLAVYVTFNKAGLLQTSDPDPRRDRCRARDWGCGRPIR